MKFVLIISCLATLVVYSQAVGGYGDACSDTDVCTAKNTMCPATGTKTCVCAVDSFSEVVSSVTSCYKKISTACDATTAPCHTTATCSSAKCSCPATMTPDANQQKCVAAGAAGIAASVLSLAVVVFTSRVL